MTHECGCCETCRAELPDHWISDLWRYCAHNQTMSKRRRRDEPWTLEHGVSPEQALAHVTAAVTQMRAWTKQRGIAWEDADLLLNWYRPRDPRGQ